MLGLFQRVEEMTHNCASANSIRREQDL
jgi:hypothetical protein